MDGCTATSDTITVVVAETPSPYISQNGEILVTAPGMDVYSWSFNGNEIGNSHSVAIQGNGDYFVWAQNDNGCEGQSEVFEVTGVSIDEHDISVEIYPNPANEFLFIHLDQTGVVEIEIYNLLGSLVLKDRINAQNLNKINVSDLSNGSYIIKIQGAQGMDSKNMVINR